MSEGQPGIRDVTDDEVAFYREHGWVLLKGLLNSAAVESLQTGVTRLMGEDAENSHHPGREHENGRGMLWNTYVHLAHQDDAVRRLVFSPSMGKLGWRLSGRPVRYWTDQMLVKLPASKGHGGEQTPWHLDLPALPQDREGQMQLWIAVRDVPPERGSLRYWDRSHRFAEPEFETRDVNLRVKPDALSGAEAQRLNSMPLEDSYAELEGAGVLTPAFDMKAGDATLHHASILHSAPANHTDEARWAYTVSLLPADVCYTGDPHWIIDGVEGLETGMPFNVPQFPVLPTPADMVATREDGVAAQLSLT